MDSIRSDPEKARFLQRAECDCAYYGESRANRADLDLTADDRPGVS